MADPKNIRVLTAEAAARDQVFLDIIYPELIIAIDAAILAETEYKVEYDINTTLAGTDGPLQIERITNTVIKKLKSLGYRASMQTPDTTELLVVTWTIAELSVADL